MGFHYMNFERLFDGELDPAEPEILLYLPDALGTARLDLAAQSSRNVRRLQPTSFLS
ncbi:MAG: hypothetical protein H0V76_08180 [Blastocatellia bacterium]|nr:hypothetical protein [Blastocatellia bacterium]